LLVAATRSSSSRRGFRSYAGRVIDNYCRVAGLGQRPVPGLPWFGFRLRPLAPNFARPTFRVVPLPARHGASGSRHGMGHAGPLHNVPSPWSGNNGPNWPWRKHPIGSASKGPIREGWPPNCAAATRYDGGRWGAGRPPRWHWPSLVPRPPPSCGRPLKRAPWGIRPCPPPVRQRAHRHRPRPIQRRSYPHRKKTGPASLPRAATRPTSSPTST